MGKLWKATEDFHGGKWYNQISFERLFWYPDVLGVEKLWTRRLPKRLLPCPGEIQKVCPGWWSRDLRGGQGQRTVLEVNQQPLRSFGTGGKREKIIIRNIYGFLATEGDVIDTDISKLNNGESKWVLLSTQCIWISARCLVK